MEHKMGVTFTNLMDCLALNLHHLFVLSEQDSVVSGKLVVQECLDI